MGTWLGGRTSYLTSKTGAVPEAAIKTSLFWTGIVLWTLGFIGNLVSDEILYNLRKPSQDGKQKPRYSVPQGFLYSKPLGGISFPAYFCEWIEWLGFAIAACSYSSSPALPSLSTIDPQEIFLSAASKASSIVDPHTKLENMLGKLATYATPPFLFFFAEIASESKAPSAIGTQSLTNSGCSYATASSKGPSMVSEEVRRRVPTGSQSHHTRYSLNLKTSVAYLGREWALAQNSVVGAINSSAYCNVV